jgi:dUTP pyrophosphatase
VLFNNKDRPQIENQGDAGADLIAAETKVIYPGNGATVRTTYIYDIDDPEMVGMVKGRSGLAFKKDILAHPGTIDAGYAGNPIFVKLWNMGHEKFTINEGDRVAQIIILEKLTHRYFETKGSTRGGGLGSTGGF